MVFVAGEAFPGDGDLIPPAAEGQITREPGAENTFVKDGKSRWIIESKSKCWESR